MYIRNEKTEYEAESLNLYWYGKFFQVQVYIWPWWIQHSWNTENRGQRTVKLWHNTLYVSTTRNLSADAYEVAYVSKLVRKGHHLVKAFLYFAIALYIRSMKKITYWWYFHIFETDESVLKCLVNDLPRCLLTL